MFFFSSLWYRTEIWDPGGGDDGYGGVEKEVLAWLFARGRHEVGADRLKDLYANGGAQLVDIRDKVRTQRVLWLKRLMSLPEGSFPRVVADELIGPQMGGYFGVGALRGVEGGLKIRTRGFYSGAIKAWS